MSMYLIITSKETGRVVLYVRPSRIHKWSILEGHFFFFAVWFVPLRLHILFAHACYKD